MSSRIFAVAIASFILISMTCGSAAPGLPSRDSNVVLPLLKQFSSKDSFAKIATILGEPDNGQAGGPEKHVWEYDYFHLNDKTEVTVMTVNNSVISITVGLPGQTGQVIYSKPNEK